VLLATAKDSNHYDRTSMLAPKPPRSVVSTKPNVVQVVQQENSGAVDKHVLIVETAKHKPALPDALPATDADSGPIVPQT
jgi:hypothetical protein